MASSNRQRRIRYTSSSEKLDKFDKPLGTVINYSSNISLLEYFLFPVSNIHFRLQFFAVS